ncbi:MAG: DsbA family protein [Candidatus Levyibacteriota bacterium]
MAVKRAKVPARAAVKPPRKISISIPSRIPQFSQQQILYTLLLVATFLVGYLIATVQYLKNPSKPADTPTAQAGQQQPGQPDPNKIYTVGNGHFPVKGDENAKVTIVEFADFRCPFCEKYFTDTEPQLMKDYVDTGKVKIYFRQYEFLGPASIVAGNAAECANEQGKFWDMHDYLYKNQPPETDTSMYTADNMAQIAGTLGMDTGKFKSCMDSSKYQKNVDGDMADGQKVNVNATPTFFVNGKQLLGAQPYANFKQAIDAALAGK